MKLFRVEDIYPPILIILLCTAHSINSCFSRQLNGLDNLMPIPTSVEKIDGRFVLDVDLEISIEGNPDDRLNGAVNRFLRILSDRTGLFFKTGFIPKIKANPDGQLKILVERPAVVRLHEDESYSLKISSDGIILSSETDLGAMHGLQTLQQLLSNNQSEFYFPGVNIEDEPRMAWRGLMMDVSRHFMPLEVIKRNLDGMDAVKLNVMHLHVCDDQGYRIESKAFPKLIREASNNQYYTFEQIEEIVEYADDRGIRVMPEIDVPGHATALLTAYPELASKELDYSLIRTSGIFDATLNPIKDDTYAFLDKLFEEVASLFPDPYFHIGGDENEGRHWDENPDIQQFMKENDIANNHLLQSYFNNRLNKTLKRLNKKMVGWEEIQTETISKDAIIHVWRRPEKGDKPGGSLYRAVENGFGAIISQGYYIDLMLPAKSHYLADPLHGNPKLSVEEEKRLLGAEATMWSELVTPQTVDSRIWPRTAAIAERYWSDAKLRDVRSMYERLVPISFLLESYGLQHVEGKEKLLRKLSNGNDVEPLRTLVNVIEPMKVYTRNLGGDMYTVFSPYTLLADVATADAPDALWFSYAVNDYKQDKISKQLLRQYLNKWKNNHENLMDVVKVSPSLKEVEPLSRNLKSIAEIGLTAIDLIESKAKPEKNWMDAAKTKLEEARHQSGRTELQVVDPIIMLVELASNP